MSQKTRVVTMLLIAAGTLVGFAAASSKITCIGQAPGKSDAPKSAAKATALQTSEPPGSPGATTTIDGKQLPPPDSKFGGVIKDTASQSKAWWPPRVVPPKQAPNILLVMTD